jgi:hypothetical protein
MASRLFEGADEANTLARERLDQPLLLPAVTDCCAGGVDAGREGRFRDDASVPRRSDQVFAADHPLAVCDDIGKEIKNLRFYLNQLAITAQLAPIPFQVKIFEEKQQLDCSRAKQGGTLAHLVQQKT